MSATQHSPLAEHFLLRRLAEARNRSQNVFDLIRPEALYDRPIAERHRIIFYIGHLEAFDWNLLREPALGLKPFHAEFDRLFAFGIDPVDGGLPMDQPSDWPALAEVQRYVSYVRERLDRELPRALYSDNGDAAQLLHVAIEHRLMHAETLAYMFHQLPLNKKIRQRKTLDVVSPPPNPVMIDIPAGHATLGLPRASTEFGWDNEFEQHRVHVPALAIDRYKVTNGEYLIFMLAGGYEDRSLWSEADWNWRVENDITHPVFWIQRNREWRYRTMLDEVPLPLHWPVYVSHAEASAYARWAGKSLPTEAQWHRAAFAMPEGGERRYPWGDVEPNSKLGNFDFTRWDPVAVNSFPRGDSGYGVSDLIGNGWEWTSTVFQPFPGFVPFAFYPGYSANFFDGQHYVMKGGSSQTAACMLRRSFRNWFQAHYQYAYAGFRCVSN